MLREEGKAGRGQRAHYMYIASALAWERLQSNPPHATRQHMRELTWASTPEWKLTNRQTDKQIIGSMQNTISHELTNITATFGNIQNGETGHHGLVMQGAG